MPDKWTEASIFREYRQAVQAGDRLAQRRIETRFRDYPREFAAIRQAWSPASLGLTADADSARGDVARESSSDRA